jgi:hypothetical protein
MDEALGALADVGVFPQVAAHCQTAPFNTPIPAHTDTALGDWHAESRAIPVSRFSFDDTVTLSPFSVAIIVAVSPTLINERGGRTRVVEQYTGARLRTALTMGSERLRCHFVRRRVVLREDLDDTLSITYGPHP